MSDTFLNAPAWAHACTLTERAAARRNTTSAPRPAEMNGDLAEQHMQRWREQRPFPDSAIFAQRLSSDGLTEQELLALLGEPVESVHARCAIPPGWLAELQRAFGVDQITSFSAAPIPKELRDRELAGFLDLIAPLIGQGRARLRDGVQALSQMHGDLPLDPDTVEAILIADLPAQLLMMLNRTMVLELNVARLQGLLSGDTAAERFQSFVERLRQREIALAMLQEYPVLARQLALCIDQWVDSSLEFVQRLCDDWPAIRAAFSPAGDPGRLARVSSASDRHRGGRTVLIVTFDSGFRLVYKPKPLSIDLHFQELLAWLNAHGDHPPFRLLNLLDRGSYGWVEFVAAQSCASAHDVQRFYQRQGAYLALLYILAATDMHFENLIAAGEQPLLIDLEALFHPRIGAFDARRNDQVIAATVDDSVLGIGLLPQQSWSDTESGGIDVSGLGATGGQLSPFAVPRWQGAGTDEARLERSQVALAPGQHRPMLNGDEANVLDYSETLVAGFTMMYRLLMQHQNELLSAEGPLARFAEDEVRVLIRPTQAYHLMLVESFHPDLLRSAIDRDRFFDRLWVSVQYQSALAPAISAEHADLLRGDIPLFTTRPGEREIWSSAHERIAGVCSESGMERARRRVQRLGDHDLDRQLWFIRAALATLATSGDRGARRIDRPAEPAGPVDTGRLLAAARRVGDRLAALALQDAEDTAWIGLTELGRGWSLAPLKMDLYHGLPGVALFLAYLGEIAQEDHYTTLARAALRKMQLQIAWDDTGITSIGGFAGWGGVIYTLTHLGVLWDQPVLLAEAEDLVERLPAMIEQDAHLDVISGAAGCIGALVSLYRCAPSERTRAAAVQCGERLLAQARPMARGIGWATLEGAQPLTGFAHGAAGIAWALVELAALTGEERFRAVALDAIAYERSLFDPQHGNWPDLREHMAERQVAGGAQVAFMAAWCHGAAGIGLARLRSLPYVDGPEARAEIDAALSTTLAHGFGHSHALCHGDFGNLDLLLQASQILDDPRWRAEANRLAADLLDGAARDGWRCATPLEVETPGLMVGLAGIGYGLLRLAAPQRVPAVLALEPPALQDPAASARSLTRLRREQARASTLISSVVSSMWSPAAYAIRIDLDDASALHEAARPRREDDFSAERLLTHPYTLPVGIQRQLFYEQYIERTRRQISGLGVAGSHVAIVRHPLVGEEPGDERIGVPMHFATAFTYEARIAARPQPIRVAGPIFVSMLHHLLATPDVPVEQKVRAAEHIFSEYLEDIIDYDVTVIAIPKRKYGEHSFEVRADTSLTHTVLLRACGSLTHYREQLDVGFYYLAHRSDVDGMLRDALFRDERALDICAAVRQIWSVEYVREKYAAHSHKQREIVDRIVQTTEARSSINSDRGIFPVR